MPIDLKIDYILLKYEIQPTLSYDSIFFSAPTNLAHRIQLWNPFFLLIFWIYDTIQTKSTI